MKRSLWLLLPLALACSSSADSTPPPVGGGAGGAGGSGAGGNGAGASGGAGGGEEPCDDPSTCEWDCMDPAVDPAIFPACPSACAGHCVPTAVLPAELGDTLAACDEDNSCVPDEFIATQGLFVAPTCTSIAGYEGRCVSKCLPLVAENEGLLPQAECDDTHLCIPCFDPMSGAATGVCDIGCDPGPSDEPLCNDPETCEWDCEEPLIDDSALPDCPSACAGHCVPPGLLPPEQAFVFDDCGDGSLCMPNEYLAAGSGHVAETCTSIGGNEGRCMSKCFPDVVAFDYALPSGGCPDTHLCVPCWDPITSEPIGVCEIGCDPGPATEPCNDPDTCEWDCPGPLIDPQALDPCPSSCAGHCIGSDSLPPDAADQLAPCGGTDLCVPDEYLVTGGQTTADSCTWYNGHEGRCLSRCLPQVEDAADELTQSSCPDSHLCTPCYDPFSGAPTGVCDLGCDPGPASPPQTFPLCCNGHSTCVPEALMTQDQQDQLGPYDCAQSPDAMLCVPTVLITGQTPDACTVSLAMQALTGHPEGACLPECLPAVEQQPLITQESCPADHRCVPCHDETGQENGLCD